MAVDHIVCKWPHISHHLLITPFKTVPSCGAAVDYASRARPSSGDGSGSHFLTSPLIRRGGQKKGQFMINRHGLMRGGDKGDETPSSEEAELRNVTSSHEWEGLRIAISSHRHRRRHHLRWRGGHVAGL